MVETDVQVDDVLAHVLWYNSHQVMPPAHLVTWLRSVQTICFCVASGMLSVAWPSR